MENDVKKTKKLNWLIMAKKELQHQMERFLGTFGTSYKSRENFLNSLQDALAQYFQPGTTCD